MSLFEPEDRAYETALAKAMNYLSHRQRSYLRCRGI